ncbi:MAG: GNAT family N-acetyltransferase [Euryarchaeota archaeon]|nr:GNAT family N-acetyltransferase [Euryarchaeota archaeon]
MSQIVKYDFMDWEDMVKIRPAKMGDLEDVESIARNTWEGHDYISQEFMSWLEDGHFYVIESGGKVVGTGKITILPGRVGWLEGLRVHPAYQKQGLGRMMHSFLLNKAKDIAEIEVLEFATHMFNKESVSMALKDGFKIVKRFYLCIRKLTSSMDFEDVTITDSDIKWNDYIPCGWKFLRVLPETASYLKHCGKFGLLDDCKFVYPVRKSELAITPLSPTRACFKKLMPAASKISEDKGAESIAYMVPEDMQDTVKYLKSMKFESWVEFKDPDVLVFRKRLRDKN